MRKYSLLRQRVMQAGLSGGEPLCEPRAATEEEILRAHLTSRFISPAPIRIATIGSAGSRYRRRACASAIEWFWIFAVRPRFVTSRLKNAAEHSDLPI